jgi:dimethylargininase
MWSPHFVVTTTTALRRGPSSKIGRFSARPLPTPPALHQPSSLLPQFRSRHTLALARALPASFAAGALSRPKSKNGDANDETDGEDSVSLTRAVQQHDAYLRAMRRHVPTLCLPALVDHPDCAFVEDAVVTIQNRAVVARIGHESRRGEVGSIRTVLEQLGIEIVCDMTTGIDGGGFAGSATCDGGDVLYTGLGRHLFVGMSSRTKEEACGHLERAFGDLLDEVIPVDLPTPTLGTSNNAMDETPLHLKSATTCLDSHTLLFPTGECGDALMKAMDPERYGYDVIRLPSMLACNVVVVKDRHVLAQDVACLESQWILKEAAQDRGMSIDFVDTSELAKKDAALTCCSVLLEI